MNIRILYFLLVLTACASCGDSSPYKGYTQTETGLYYKLQMIGDGKRRPAIGDFLQLVITYKTERDSVFLDSYSVNDIGMVILPFNHSSFEGSFEEGLTTMNEGDSVSFIVAAAPLFSRFFKAKLPMFLSPESRVKMEVKLHKIMNQAEYEAELRRYAEIIEDRDIEEQRKIQVFVESGKEKYTKLDNGMFYLQVSKGEGDRPARGNLVRMNYYGRFLSGKVFESTYDRGQPMEFVYGEQGQVIKGLETAISLMNEGSKAKFIIPSHLAYGEEGSSTGIIPPYTTVVYEIELLNLTKK